jgi:Domain of unknown function (DUF4115)
VERVVFALALLAVGVVAALTYSAWRDYRNSAPSAAAAVVRVKPATQTPTREEGTVASTQGTPATTSPTPVPAARRPATLVLSATRGDSWLAIRAGSETGATLFEGTLAQGKSVRVRRRVLWVRVGAPSFLDATLNGRRVELPTGTATLRADRNRLTTLSLG